MALSCYFKSFKISENKIEPGMNLNVISFNHRRKKTSKSNRNDLNIEEGENDPCKDRLNRSIYLQTANCCSGNKMTSYS